MKKNYLVIVFNALLISVVGVFVIDFLSHLLFSSPMETTPYFVAKMSLYFVFSILFLSLFNLEHKEFTKVLIAGVVVSLVWGTYYNILPALFDFYPFGIPLEGLTFLGMGLLGTGLAFGTVHTVAFIGGYYSAKFLYRHA